MKVWFFGETLTSCPDKASKNWSPLALTPAPRSVSDRINIYAGRIPSSSTRNVALGVEMTVEPIAHLVDLIS